MGRLTIKDKNACKSCDIWDWCAEKQPPCPVYRVYEKLAHYEDMEEQGRLIEQKNGAWNENTSAFCSICSECGAIVDSYAIKRQSGKLNYCPNCGAKMKLKELEG